MLNTVRPFPRMITKQYWLLTILHIVSDRPAQQNKDPKVSKNGFNAARICSFGNSWKKILSSSSRE